MLDNAGQNESKPIGKDIAMKLFRRSATQFRKPIEIADGQLTVCRNGVTNQISLTFLGDNHHFYFTLDETACCQLEYMLARQKEMAGIATLDEGLYAAPASKGVIVEKISA